jgi:hypothetical protein
MECVGEKENSLCSAELIDPNNILMTALNWALELSTYSYNANNRHQAQALHYISSRYSWTT